jgi:hypothetical protein
MPYEICGVIGDRIIVDDNHLVVRVLQTRQRVEACRERAGSFAGRDHYSD